MVFNAISGDLVWCRELMAISLVVWGGEAVNLTYLMSSSLLSLPHSDLSPFPAVTTSKQIVLTN